MLENMRKRRSSFIIWFFFGIIIIAFIISFGPGSFNRAHFGGGGVGSVNGEPITKTQFDNIFAREYEQRKQYDKDITEEEALELQSRVFDRLVDSTLWLQQAQSLDLDVTDGYMAEQIRDNSLFQEDGHFSEDRYRRYVAYGYNTTVKQYERDLRRELGSGLLRNALMDSAYMTRAEAWEMYRIEKEKVDLEFIQIATERAAELGFTGVASEADVAQWLAKEDALKTYYDEHVKGFVKGKRVQVAEIIVPLGLEVTPEQKESALKKANDIRLMLTPDNFVQSLPAMVNQGARTVEDAVVAVGEKPEPWDTPVFAMAKNAVSDPISLNDGIHLVYVKDTLPPLERKLDDADVKKEIAGILAADAMAKTFLAEKARGFITELGMGKTVNELVPYENADGTPITHDAPPAITSGRTKSFSRNAPGYIRGLGLAPDIMAAAFKLSANDRVAGPFTVEKDLCIIRLVEHLEVSEEDFAKEFDQYVTSNLWPHKSAAVEGYTQWMRTSASIESTLSVATPE